MNTPRAYQVNKNGLRGLDYLGLDYLGLDYWGLDYLGQFLF